jgi:diguanylate cyclase (GGDEF)-like protein
MGRKIVLVGQDRVGKTRISALLDQCELADFEYIRFSSIHKVKNALFGSDPCLVLIHLNRREKVEDFLGYMRESHPQVPIILIMTADHHTTQTLMKKGIHHIIHPDHVDEISLTQVILAAIEQKCVENELRTRDAIMQAVNYAAEVFLSQMDWESRIDEVLARLGGATQSDRVYIYRNEMRQEIGLVPVLQAEWTADGVQPLKGFPEINGNVYQASSFRRWLEVFKEGEIICSSVLELPSEEQAYLLKMDIQTLVVVPIFTDQLWWGFVGYDQCRCDKKWSSVEVDALKTAAKILGAAISRQDAETRLTHLATHDYLTNLPNRMLLEDRFTSAVARAERSGKKFGIVAIDLDKFKLINDTHGHQFGDKVLIEVAWRLSEAVRSSDTCARVGGDEFTILAEGMNNKKDLLRVMEKLTRSLESDISIDGKQVFVTASMGASIYPNHGTQMEQLMKAADIALYQVKDAYSGRKIFIDEQYSWLKE